jgi:acetyl-CoA carboxylase carboxyl transferase subunit alpha
MSQSFEPFDFEKPIFTIQEKIQELMKTSQESGIDFQEEIETLSAQAEVFRQKLYKNLQPKEKVQIARHPQRPSAKEVIQQLSPETWFELHGDRAGQDDQAIIGGIIELIDRPVMVVGTQKGRTMKENLVHNFGMPNPEGYRKAMRLFKHANKFGMPIVTLIDTPGAYPGIAGEQHGIGIAIAENIRDMARLRVPVVSMVLGEGCSGGALGIGVANEIYMLEHSVYTVISPEGCASILWRSAEHAARAAEALKITAQDLLQFGMIEGIIPEPLGGAHYDPEAAIKSMRTTLTASLTTLMQLSPQELVEQRYQKFRKIGAFEEARLAKSRS